MAMRLILQAFIISCLLLQGCSSKITMDKANEIALAEFQANYEETFSNYSMETNEGYSFSEKNGDPIACYKITFLDDQVVPIATYLISKKDGVIVKSFKR